MKELIECPNCQRVLEGHITKQIPFDVYFAACLCGYLITESDWNPVKEVTP